MLISVLRRFMRDSFLSRLRPQATVQQSAVRWAQKRCVILWLAGRGRDAAEFSLAVVLPFPRRHHRVHA